ncbi:hypothetical protein C6P40_001491 [Pichia californica]|uniref:Uncharacterized protein n=1 Tax=Pichia californica TaxID=460514 RepID=A0A9P6WP85_9ASCO|nr:hypothetical protein C6P42_002996 [[Candida] californica]KAG0690759.1 hypothetical protein C6P40_001491 [[Candida] californica]
MESNNSRTEWKKEKANLKDDPQTSIKVAYECVKKILELDTENVVSDLNVMESINNVSILRFRDLELYCADMKANSEIVKQSEDKLKKSIPMLAEIERKIDELHSIVVEMNEWSKELEVKSKRASSK